ncbi:MAG: C40 family peptidase [Deltaproteobacteria bacterium]|jgi:LysM repeat protein|nr:C40 family peptidase [Deltaproteobacteria bacterium]
MHASSICITKKQTFSKLYLILILTLLLGLTACQSTRKNLAIQARPSADAILTQMAQTRVNSILKTAFSQVGNPYRYGGSSPETGFDCSGFVGWVYAQYGIDLPRSSRDMMSVGTPIDRSELRPGDLVFFNYGYHHVGIYTGDNKYIHSPSTGKRIQESDLNGRGRTEHYVGARRIIDNRGVTTISENLKDLWVKESRHQTALALNDTAAQRHTGANAAYKPTRTATKSNTTKKKKGSSTTNTAKGKTHKVASGDTIVDLANRYGVTTQELVAYNNIKDVRKIKPGQTIKIPDSTSKSAKAQPTSKSNSKSKKKTSKPKAKSNGKKKG